MQLPLQIRYHEQSKSISNRNPKPNPNRNHQFSRLGEPAILRSGGIYLPRWIPLAEHGGLHQSQGPAGEEQCFPSQDCHSSELRSSDGTGSQVNIMWGLLAYQPTPTETSIVTRWQRIAENPTNPTQRPASELLPSPCHIAGRDP